ncbi:helix-turn-helix transcriptional regulator [Branchiibius sp. NY16-3462-2]|uniref:helix-turn-helix domain-containing protein n=1 Tax=Branchiibius sp. NY16-3462-2 TaxID=1807500 RepID=UPI000798DAC3|nr:helix-turn-helix transcriptional regulator [Branchiibius sp. NY16-3462-2]KYH44163.1 transcriptional regulator [Branchiibius sp. NY16-3462-2]
MDGASLLEEARAAAGLSQAALAAAAGTSRPTLSAYENGRKSPSIQTASRLLEAAGFELTVAPRVEFQEMAIDRGRPILVPTELPRLPLDRAFAVVELPLHLNWSDRGRVFDLRDRRQRARVYEIVLREGRPEDVLSYVDGALLVDLWDELVLPRPVRLGWDSLVKRATEPRIA